MRARASGRPSDPDIPRPAPLMPPTEPFGEHTQGQPDTLEAGEVAQPATSHPADERIRWHRKDDAWFRPETPLPPAFSIPGRQDILGYVANRVRAPETRLVVLQGRRRHGKTTLLRALEQQLSGTCQPMYFDLHGWETQPLGTFLSELAESVHRLAGSMPPRWQKRDDPGQARLQLHAALKKLNPERPLVLLLDELSAWLPSSGSDLTGRRIYRYIQELTMQEPSFRAVLALGRHPGMPELASPLQVLERAPTRQLLPLSESAALEVLHPLHQTGPGLEDSALTWILQQSGRQPWLLQLLGAEAWHLQHTRQGPPISALELSGHQARALRAGREGLDWMWEGFSSIEQDVLSAIGMALPIDRPVGRPELEQRLRQNGKEEALNTLDGQLQRLEADGIVTEQRERDSHLGYTLQAELLRAYVGTFQPLQRSEQTPERTLRQNNSPDAPRLRTEPFSSRATAPKSATERSSESTLTSRALALETAIPAPAPLLDPAEDGAWDAPIEQAHTLSRPGGALSSIPTAQDSSPLGSSARESWFAQASLPGVFPDGSEAPGTGAQADEAFSPSLPLPAPGSVERSENPSTSRPSLPRASSVATRPRLPLGGAEVLLPSLKSVPTSSHPKGTNSSELNPPRREPTAALTALSIPTRALEDTQQAVSSAASNLDIAPSPERIPAPHGASSAATSQPPPAWEPTRAELNFFEPGDIPTTQEFHASPDETFETSSLPAEAALPEPAPTSIHTPATPANVFSKETVREAMAPDALSTPEKAEPHTPRPLETAPETRPLAGPVPPVPSPRRTQPPVLLEHTSELPVDDVHILEERNERYTRALALWQDDQLEDAQLLLASLVAEYHTFKDKGGNQALVMLDRVTTQKLGYIKPPDERSGLSRGRVKMLSMGSFLAGVLLSIGAMQLIQPVQEAAPTTLEVHSAEPLRPLAQLPATSDAGASHEAPLSAPTLGAPTPGVPTLATPEAPAIHRVEVPTSAVPAPPPTRVQTLEPDTKAPDAGHTAGILAEADSRQALPSVGRSEGDVRSGTLQGTAPNTQSKTASSLPGSPAGELTARAPTAKSAEASPKGVAAATKPNQPTKTSTGTPTPTPMTASVGPKTGAPVESSTKRTSEAKPPGLKTVAAMSSTALLVPSGAAKGPLAKAPKKPIPAEPVPANTSMPQTKPALATRKEPPTPEKAQGSPVIPVQGKTLAKGQTPAGPVPASASAAKTGSNDPTPGKSAKPTPPPGPEKTVTAALPVRQSGDRLGPETQRPPARAKPAGTDEDPFAPAGTSRARKEPRDAYERALLAAEANRLDDAFSLLREAVRETPERAEVWAELGQVHERLGRPDDALRAWSKAVQLDPTMPRAWYGVGKLLQSRGRKAEAIQAFQQVVALAPAGTLSRDASRRLGQLEQADTSSGGWGPGTPAATPVKVFQGEGKR